MSFQISEIVELKADGLAVKVSHQGHQVDAVLPNTREHDVVVGADFQAKISYAGLLGWKIVDDFDEARSGIWQEQDGIHLLGRVHTLLDYGDGKISVDVYLQNGPEFFSVDADILADIPEANDGLEITVGRLYVYPDQRREGR